MVDSVQIKTCKACEISLPIERFYKRTDKKTGKIYFDNKCKACRYKREQELIQSNPEVREMRRRRHLRYSQTDKGKASQRKTNERRQREWREKYGVQYCQCGCGEETVYRNGVAAKYKRGHVHRIERFGLAKDPLSLEGYLPADKVRKMFLDYKRKHDLSWREMADFLGYSFSNLQSIMYDERISLRRSTVEHAIRRMAGLPTSPTEYEKKKYEPRRVS